MRHRGGGVKGDADAFPSIPVTLDPPIFRERSGNRWMRMMMGAYHDRDYENPDHHDGDDHGGDDHDPDGRAPSDARTRSARCPL
jgi:hypothetical protein